MRRPAGVDALRFAGSRMGMSQVGLPTRKKVDPAFRRPLDLSARLQCAPGRPRVVRMPSDWWDSPAVAACPLGLSGEVMCAVLDPSYSAPVLKTPDRDEEAGRGLQMVDALSDVWGWSPVTGRGKAVWAILFCA